MSSLICLSCFKSVEELCPVETVEDVEFCLVRLELLDVLFELLGRTDECTEGASLLPIYALSFESFDSKLESEL